MTGTKAYPITHQEDEIVPLLKDSFCRAVVFRPPFFYFDPSKVSTISDPSLAARYWQDPHEPRGRLASGKIPHTQDLTVTNISQEAEEAKINLTTDALVNFTARCNVLRGLFSRVFSSYTGIENPVLRGFTLFTPIGGLGRSPDLHVDNTILTLHWSAALSTFRIHDGDLEDNIWHALDRKKQNVMSDQERTQNHAKLIQIARNLPMIENAIGDIMITKGQLGLDLSQTANRNAVCVHVSSPTITQNGQAGFLMTPKMPELKN